MIKRSKIRSKILNYFFMNENESAYINALARILDSDPKNIYRVLTRLEEEGFLKSEFRGKERYFSVNSGNPLYSHYREIFIRTEGLEEILKERLRKVDGIEEAFIFGSYAGNRFNSQSDIDILLVGKHKSLDVQRSLFDIQKSSGREFNVINLTPEEFRLKKTSKDNFITSVLSGKIIRLI